jgi:geranylgeranyl pyrophosphate synthase
METMARMLNKSNAKSIRMTDEVFGYINNFKGDGFNEKLENIVLFAKKHEPKIKERIAILEEKEEELKKEVEKLYSIKGSLQSISRYIDQAKSYIDNKPLKGQMKLE